MRKRSIAQNERSVEDYPLTGIVGEGNDTMATAVYNVPMSPSGNGRAVISEITVRVTGDLTGPGAFNYVKAGLSSGGNEFITSRNVDASTTIGTIYGLDTTQLGSAMVSTTNYRAVLAASDAVYVTIVGNGAISVAPTFSVSVRGWLIA